jgi:hypothetical protein
MKHSTIESERYEVHVRLECEAVEGGGWCQTCFDLIWLADVADQVRRFEPSTVG